MPRMTIAAIAVLLAAAAQAAPRIQTMKVDQTHVDNWNAFADACLALHREQIAGRDVRQEERVGGYANYPDFYREVSYYDRTNGRLLSRVQWERAEPDRLHAIEVYVRDGGGRVLRDYSAAYLPQGRNAPVQTLINLHAYNGDLHAFRQFDASGDRLYEYCEGNFEGEAVQIRLFEDDLAGVSEHADRVMASPAYQACFQDLPPDPGPYLDPR